ncbi:hypothetical protein JXA05_00900 [Candidatus Peregrinibacteria bacterium]|nr:hypothetical protein [Candidatus Peregrinibacteria bacterium]
MKNAIRLIALPVAIAFFAGTAGAASETVSRVTVELLRKDTRNLVVTWEGEKTLLHYQGKCDEMEEGKTVSLAIRGELNGNDDYIKINEYRSCKIDQVENITGTLAVDYVYNGNTNAFLTDEAGNQFEVQYDSRCQSMPRSFKDYIYVKQYGTLLQKNDELVLSRFEGKCPVLYVWQRKKSEPSQPKPTEDVIPPSMVTGAKAIPRKSGAYVYWKTASDNVGIDYYWVSYSPYKIDPKDYAVKDMPNLTQSLKKNITITGLDNERFYYFYVIAVDKSGNASSSWSWETKAMPRSSISEFPAAATAEKLGLHLAQETSASFLFKWDSITGAERVNVLLEVDAKRELVYYSYTKNTIRIAKKESRDGKQMKLIVRAYDIHGQMKEESISFRFRK